MRSASQLTQRLKRLIWSKSSTTFFLNGAPGSGKSRLLGKLAQRLDEGIPRSYVLGPYGIQQEDLAVLERRILQDCQKASFLDRQPDGEKPLDLVGTWTWFADNAYVSADHTFLVLVDLAHSGPLHVARLGSLFSRARQLEGTWKHENIRLFHMFTGYWDHPALQRHFRDISTSFPYTPGDNYAVWDGISVSEFTGLLRDAAQVEAEPIMARTLFELTDGHPAAALDILEAVDVEDVSVRSLLSATGQAADDGPAGGALVDAWIELPASCRGVLKQLVLRRHLPRRSMSDRWRQLAVAGAVRDHDVGDRRYVSFKSWYAELLVRAHTEQLAIEDPVLKRIRANDLMPAIAELNVRAYAVIHDIENQVRNFVATRLYLRNTTGHILRGRSSRANDDAGGSQDAYARASDWCRRSLDKGVLNPLLAYLSTRDLAYLVKEIGRDLESGAWQGIGNAILEVSDIRDAVMHNQLIEVGDLQRLRELRADIYEALNEC